MYRFNIMRMCVFVYIYRLCVICEHEYKHIGMYAHMIKYPYEVHIYIYSTYTYIYISSTYTLHCIYVHMRKYYAGSPAIEHSSEQAT